LSGTPGGGLSLDSSILFTTALSRKAEMTPYQISASLSRGLSLLQTSLFALICGIRISMRFVQVQSLRRDFLSLASCGGSMPNAVPVADCAAFAQFVQD